MRKEVKSKSKSEIKAIIFDVGGVLQLDSVTPSKMRVEHSGVHEYMAKKFKIPIDTWFDAIDTIYAKSIENKTTKKQVIKTIAKNLRTDEKTLLKSFAKAYKKFFKKNKPLYKIASKLKKQGYIIGILSDQWHISQENLMPKKDIKDFSIVIVSSEVGIRKPNPEIYKLLIKKVKEKNKTIKPNQILFIDNRKWNMKNAKLNKIKTLIFKNNKQTIKDLKKLGVKI